MPSEQISKGVLKVILVALAGFLFYVIVASVAQLAKDAETSAAEADSVSAQVWDAIELPARGIPGFWCSCNDPRAPIHGPRLRASHD